jgi:tape measure domain-containing protein
VATIRTAIQIQNGMTPALKSMNSALNMVLSSFESLQSVSGNSIDTASIKAARAELNKSEIAINSVEQEIREAAEAQNQLNDKMNHGSSAANNLLRGIGRIAGAAGVAFGIKGITNLSDTMTSTTARLKMMNDGLQTTEELQQMIYQSADNSRAKYVDTAAAVAKLGVLAGDAFGSTEEIVAFAEQMNKQFVIGGASVQEQTSAMYQLTQAMAAGKLQGDEFRSIMENAPMLAQSIADYMDIPKGELKEMSSDGVITADIIKNALFSVADETNAKFEEMPMTWAQVGNEVANTMLQVFDPVIQGIGEGAQWVGDNWENLQPLFFGVAAGVTAYAVAMGISNAVTWLGVAANKALIVTMLTNPYTWVAVGIGLVVAAIYKWVQSVGGISIAWMIAKDKILYAWDLIGVGVMTGVYGIADFMGFMKVAVLTELQGMVNDAIDIVNTFITAVNKIPGVAFDTLDHMTFATTAQVEFEAEQRGRADALKNLKYDANLNHSMRQMEIDIARENAAAQANNSGIDYAGLYNNTYDTAENTSKIADSMEISEEELKYIRDMAERETVNRFTTAEVKVEMTNNNNINSDMDIDGIIDQFAEKLEESITTIAEGVHE